VAGSLTGRSKKVEKKVEKKEKKGRKCRSLLQIRNAEMRDVPSRLALLDQVLNFVRLAAKDIRLPMECMLPGWLLLAETS
jgi:hypothetical protein